MQRGPRPRAGRIVTVGVVTGQRWPRASSCSASRSRAPVGAEPPVQPAREPGRGDAAASASVHLRRRDQDHLRSGRPGRLRCRGAACEPGAYPSPAASIPPATAAARRCASTPVSGPPRRRTAASTTCSSVASRASSVAFDLPTQMGYDSDAVMAAGPGRGADRQRRGHGPAPWTASTSARSAPA